MAELFSNLALGFGVAFTPINLLDVRLAAVESTDVVGRSRRTGSLGRHGRAP